MNWFFIAIIAYLLFAVNSVIDKYLLRGGIANPIAYSFYVGLFSIFAVVLLPFGVHWPGFEQFFYALIVGFVYLLALVAFFIALKADEVSRITSLVGATTPVFTFLLSSFIFEEYLGRQEIVAFLFLIAGGILISIRKNAKCSLFEFKEYSCAKNTEIGILAALLFAIFFVFADHIYDSQGFISGFFYTRMGGVLGALLFLLLPVIRGMVLKSSESVSNRSFSLFVFNKTLAGVAFLILNYAIFLGKPALVNALEGAKYVFVLFMAFFLSKKLPNIIKEQTSIMVMFQKVFAIVLIFIGMFLLSGF